MGGMKDGGGMKIRGAGEVDEGMSRETIWITYG